MTVASATLSSNSAPTDESDFPPPKKKTSATPNRMGVFFNYKSPPTNFSATGWGMFLQNKWHETAHFAHCRERRHFDLAGWTGWRSMNFNPTNRAPVASYAFIQTNKTGWDMIRWAASLSSTKMDHDHISDNSILQTGTIAVILYVFLNGSLQE